MVASFSHQYRCLLVHGLKMEMAHKERLITPLLFAATLLLLFNFVLDDPTPSLQPKFFIAESFLAILFALQSSYARVFGPDQEDRVFELLQTTPLSHSAWFLGKYTLTLITSTLVVVPTMILTSMIHSSLHGVLWALAGPLTLVVFLSLAGLASLGILLSTVTMKASGREVLFPLLYFPLTIPVLLAASQAGVTLLSGGMGEIYWQWLGLLLGFDIIYVTLGILLFGELVASP